MKITVTQTYDLDLFIHTDYKDGFGSEGEEYVAGREKGGEKWFFINRDGSVETVGAHMLYTARVREGEWIQIDNLPWEN